MRQKIQRLLLFSVGMSSLVLVSEPMIPSILPALAAAGQDTGTIHQNNSHEKSQHPGQFDGKVIAQKNELTRATAPSHRLIGRTPSPQSLVEINNDASLHPSLSTSPVASFGADDSQPRGISSQFSGPSTATPSSQLGGIIGSGFGATSTVQPTPSLLGVTAQTSQAVAAPQASPMQTQPSSTPLRRLMSEIPGLKQLVAPSITILPPPSLKPAIGVSSPSFSFSLQQGDGSPTAQTLTITNIGGGTLDWNAVSTAAWLNLSPAFGKDAGTIALTAATGSLAAGTYTALVTVSAPNATPVSLPVTFTVTAPSPTLTVSPTAVIFSGGQGGTNPASQSVTVTSNGNWTASSSAPWLTLSPSSGSGNGSIAANVVLSAAAVGQNQATITVTSGGVTRTTAVTFTVATLTAAPSSLTYTATKGAADPAAQTITVSANGAWTVSDNASWLNLSSTSGTGNGSTMATVTTGSLAAGTYTALVTVSAPNATPVSLPVTFTVTAPSPTLIVSPTAVIFSGGQGGTNPASQSVTVTSNGNWTASSSAPWLTLSPSSGSGNGSIAANVVLSAAAVGQNQATITVTSGGVTRTTAVTFTVATLTAAPSSLTYTATQNAANPAAQTITISANGAWTVSDNAAWLSLSQASGSKNGTITASANTATATQGLNSTTITVTSGGITRTVNVTLTLNPPASSSVTLTWKANTESDLAGYKVYRATSSGAYGAPIAAIPGNTTSYTATGLQLNATYFFVVTAYDIAGNESAYSNEVSKSVY